MKIEPPKKPARILGVIFRLTIIAVSVWIGTFLLAGSLMLSKFGLILIAAIMIPGALLVAIQQFLLRRAISRKKMLRASPN